MGTLLSWLGFESEEETERRYAHRWSFRGEEIFSHSSHMMSSNSAGNRWCPKCGGQAAQNPHVLDNKCVPRTFNGREARHWTWRGDPIFAHPSHVMEISGGGNWGCGACNIWAADDGHALDNVCDVSPAVTTNAGKRWWQ